MTNYIISGDLTINGNLSINGTLYCVTNESNLINIENIDEYNPLSGVFDDLVIEGNLVFCEYQNFDLVINGSFAAVNSEKI